jgi:hypothetical protein
MRRRNQKIDLWRGVKSLAGLRITAYSEFIFFKEGISIEVHGGSWRGIDGRQNDKESQGGGKEARRGTL